MTASLIGTVVLILTALTIGEIVCKFFIKD
jgi:hypothetical protein